MKKQVSVLVGAGSIGQAIIRRVSAGKHIVLADYSLEHAERAAKTLEDAGFECSTIQCDLGSKEDILKLVEFATGKGEVTNLVNAAGVSPSQAPVEEILRVDLYGTSVLLEEFGKIIAEGGSGVIISSQSGHRLPALPQEQNEALATTPVDELLELPFLKAINDTLKAYQYSKRCNVLRVMYEATRWGRRGATINSKHQPGHHHHPAGQRRTARPAQGRLSEDDRRNARQTCRNTRRSWRLGSVPDVLARPLHQRCGPAHRRRLHRLVLVR